MQKDVNRASTTFGGSFVGEDRSGSGTFSGERLGVFTRFLAELMYGVSDHNEFDVVERKEESELCKSGRTNETRESKER